MVAVKAVAVKELKNRLSAYLREVATGQVVLVTDRGNGTTATGDPLILLRRERQVTGKNVKITAPPMQAVAKGSTNAPRMPSRCSRSIRKNVAAQHPEVVARLRARKHREQKPFAVLTSSPGSLGHVSAADLALLRSPACPIVLVERRRDAPVAPSVSAGGCDPPGTGLGPLMG